MPLPNIFHGVAEAFSKTTKITFRVSDLEKVNYNVGETIKGHIFLASASPLHIASLDVCLSGREEVHEAAKKTNHPFKPPLMRPILNRKDLEAGQHSFSFELPVAATQPTIYCPGQFNVTYAVQASLRLTTAPNSVFVTYHTVFIHPTPVSEIAHAFVERKQGKLIHHRERIILRCLPSMAQIQLYEPLELDLTIQNDHRKEISRVLVGLDRHVMTGKHLKAEEHVIVHQIEDRHAITPGSRYETSLPFKIDCKPGVHIPATYDGYRLRISYHLVFTCEFLTGGQWECRMPIVVRSAPFELEKRDDEVRSCGIESCELEYQQLRHEPSHGDVSPPYGHPSYYELPTDSTPSPSASVGPSGPPTYADSHQDETISE